eukprot:7659532-Pyramimonas_sp.AAC.1
MLSQKVQSNNGNGNDVDSINRRESSSRNSISRAMQGGAPPHFAPEAAQQAPVQAMPSAHSPTAQVASQAPADLAAAPADVTHAAQQLGFGRIATRERVEQHDEDQD